MQMAIGLKVAKFLPPKIPGVIGKLLENKPGFACWTL
jgi:hypothetical protein